MSDADPRFHEDDEVIGHLAEDVGVPDEQFEESSGLQPDDPD